MNPSRAFGPGRTYGIELLCRCERRPFAISWLDPNYDKLADRGERGDLTIKPGTVRRRPNVAA